MKVNRLKVSLLLVALWVVVLLGVCAWSIINPPTVSAGVMAQEASSTPHPGPTATPWPETLAEDSWWFDNPFYQIAVPVDPFTGIGWVDDYDEAQGLTDGVFSRVGFVAQIGVHDEQIYNFVIVGQTGDQQMEYFCYNPGLPKLPLHEGQDPYWYPFVDWSLTICSSPLKKAL